MSTGGDVVGAEALGYEVEKGHHPVACDVELLDDLVDAEILAGSRAKVLSYNLLTLLWR